MFYEIDLTKKILVSPKFFGPELRNTLIQKLRVSVEGKCLGQFGYVILVKSILKIGRGKVDESFSHAVYMVKYKAIVFRPFKGDVVDSTVTIVNKFGFYCEAGPFQIFVSHHRIPDDMKFDPSTTNESIYISKEDPENRIAVGDEVRVRILGIQEEQGNFFGVGTIDESYLGPF